MKLLLFCTLVSICIIESRAAWNLVWSDEFNGNTLDEGKWKYEEGCSGWGNNELECYTVRRAENVRVQNGNLVIHVNVENFNGKQYTSGRLNSKQSWTYGRFEARAKLPKGKHLWPAIWMMPANSVYGGWAASGEIDIMESRGQTVNSMSSTVHYGGSWPNNVWTSSGDKHQVNDFSADFHVFALEWDANDMKFSVDGNVHFTQTMHKNFYSGKGNNPYTKEGQPFDQNFFWIFNIAVGGNFFPSNVYGDLSVNDAHGWAKPTMEIDYVRVYHWQ